MYNILICDDQPDIVNALKIYLTPEDTIFSIQKKITDAIDANTATEPYNTLHRDPCAHTQ